MVVFFMYSVWTAWKMFLDNIFIVKIRFAPCKSRVLIDDWSVFLKTVYYEVRRKGIFPYKKEYFSVNVNW